MAAALSRESESDLEQVATTQLRKKSLSIDD